MNIVLFGDSHLARFGKNTLDALESLVDGARVYNCAAGGLTSIDGARRAAYVATLTPDVIIISFGGNDVAPWKTVTPKADYLRNMQAILAAFPDSKKVLFFSPDVAVSDAMQTEAYNETLHEYRAGLELVIGRMDVAVIDGNRILLPFVGNYHTEDGVHMSDRAYETIVEAFADAVRSL